MKHPHEAAIEILCHRASAYYSYYLDKTTAGLHEEAWADYCIYVELNTSAQFLSQNLPSGVLNPAEVTPVLVAPTLPSRFPPTFLTPN